MIRVCVFLLLFFAPLSAHAAPLAGSEWGLGNADQRFVQFRAGGKAGGHGGCNSFFARYEANARKLRIRQIGSTRKMCSPAAMKKEREWFALLRRVRAYEATDLKLTLYGAKRTVLAIMNRRDFD